MIVSNLIEELRQKNIEISFSAGKLKYSGPEENITPDVVEKLKKNKGKLIKYLWPKELGNLMPINPAGNQIPLFVVHGDNSNYIISEHFGPDQPVYGFFHPGSEGEGIHYKSVKKMAAEYLNMLLTVCPSGPYYLIGYSFGGVIAFEMAVQLQKAGHKVPFLVIIDSISPLAREPFVWQSNLFRKFKINILRPIRIAFTNEINYLINNIYILANRPIPIERRSEYLWYKYLTLTRKYSPAKFDGDILLFRLTGNPSSYKYLGWETLVNDIKMIEIEGKHLEVFKGKDRNDILTTEVGKYLNYIRGLNLG
jgi:thioesterase domain-containing protein